MPPPTKDKLLAFLRQVRRPPWFLFIGSGDVSILNDLGCKSDFVSPIHKNVWGEINRRVASVDEIVVLPGVRNDFIEAVYPTLPPLKTKDFYAFKGASSYTNETLFQLVFNALGRVNPVA